MKLDVAPDRRTMGQRAGGHGAASLRRVLEQRPAARLVACTGSSQFEVLEAFTAAPGIDWARVEMFHLDEYVGIPETHPASFRRFLRERLIDKTGIVNHHLLNGNANAYDECGRVGQLIQKAAPDLAFVGIGENGHLAFNDPPADFDTAWPYIVVSLDEACRRQQVGEGWFVTPEDVPRQAMSMSIQQIMKSREIICSCPDARKAQAVKSCLEGPVSNLAPASMLQRHPNVTIYLDRESAALLKR